MAIDWMYCRIGSCHRHEACMYYPCRVLVPSEPLPETTPKPVDIKSVFSDDLKARFAKILRKEDAPMTDTPPGPTDDELVAMMDRLFIEHRGHDLSGTEMQHTMGIILAALRPLLQTEGLGMAMGGSQVLGEIAAERRRQIEVEGWSPEHDDAHRCREMALAAACYASAPSMIRSEREWVAPDAPKEWPWHRSWWKPGFRRRNLIKAGALIVAEIERLDRSLARRHAGDGK